ncbi:MAG: fibrillarin-like rRNA/tRNA 2'-O-methyltransferase [Methanomassiliicoccales archaeon]
MEIHLPPRTLYEEGRLYTLNAAPGWRLPGQTVVVREGMEYRSWNPYRSKVAAYILCGGLNTGFADVRRILYLGGSYGTTVSHLADVAPTSTIYAVELFSEPLRSLQKIALTYPNIVPVMGDASSPEGYAQLVEEPEFLIQDIAQRDQLGILLRNMEAFRSLRSFIFFLKTASVDSTRPAGEVVAEAEKTLGRRFSPLERVDIGRYERGHFALSSF